MVRDTASRSGNDDGPVAPTPPGSVLLAWQVDTVELLPGGQGQAFRSGDLVFKPAAEPARSVWLAEALDGPIQCDGVRITRPARSTAGTWVVDGWTAWHWLDGQPWTPTLPELFDVSARFHAALDHVPWNAAMVGSDRWAVADRIAWGELDGAVPHSLERLADAREPVPLGSQLIHGDLHGNLLMQPGLPPAVIDISPFWRPATYASAIALVDRVAYGPPGGRLEPDLLGSHGRQLLIRAVLFRALSELEPTNAYDPLIKRLLDQE